MKMQTQINVTGPQKVAVAMLTFAFLAGGTAVAGFFGDFYMHTSGIGRYFSTDANPRSPVYGRHGLL